MGEAEQDKSRRELEGFFARHRLRLVRMAQRIVRDEHEAEDIVQETMAAILRRLDADPLKHLAAYVSRAVEHNALKALARRRVSASLDEANPPASMEPSPDEADELEIDPVTVEQALMQLPTAQQVVIRMKYYMGYSFRQIGDVLAISINTAASRCRYALAALRARLAQRPKGPSGEQDKE
ncbi:MAG: sigma-70 family RNA polymerase sigma factor [Phycisphaerae bacterium]|jgi:RNA polymerase sigma-70 factor (ECF subfamily)